MIIRKLKLKLNKTQEQQLDTWLWRLTGVYNWAIKKIENNAKNKIYFSKYDFQNLLAGHGKKIDIPSHAIQGVLIQAYTAWERCFKKMSRKPRLKGVRNKLNSIPFPDPIKPPEGNKISIPGMGKVRFHKQDIPEGAIKCGRIIKKPSGWYLCLWIDTVHTFPVKKTKDEVGIDPGFSTLLTLSNGEKIENPRELRKGAERLAQAQRAGDKKLVARLHERQANKRRDRNHKISRKIVENYKKIYYSKDNFSELARTHGKSVSEAGLGQLISTITYKGSACDREVIPVDSQFTTMTCSVCGSRTGPSDWDKLAVRQWNCACGAQHDRDINSARNVLLAGAGSALKATGKNRGN